MRLHAIAAEGLMFRQSILKNKIDALFHYHMGIILTIASYHYSLPTWVTTFLAGRTVYKMAWAVKHGTDLDAMNQARPIFTEIKRGNYGMALGRLESYQYYYMLPYYSIQESEKLALYLRSSCLYFKILSAISYCEPKTANTLQQVQKIVDQVVFSRWTEECNRANITDKFKIPRIRTNAALLILFKKEAFKDPLLDSEGRQAREYMALVAEHYPPLGGSVERRFIDQILATKTRQEVVNCVDLLSEEDVNELKRSCGLELQ